MGRAILVGLGGVICIVGLLFFGRFMVQFNEETRRLGYQESVTGQTACRANLTRLYREWTKAEGPHARALELEARAEADRYRCSELPLEIENWVEAIR